MTDGKVWAPELRFPAPPVGIVPVSGEALATKDVAAAYLKDVAAWRERLLAALSGSGHVIPEHRGFTPRARKYMAGLLSERWHPDFQAWADGSAYNLAPLAPPTAAARARGPRMVALDVLRWRAGIYDFLSDIWDVIGEPMLDMFECNAMAAFLVPVGARRCIFCLAAEPNHHPCVVLAHVRSKWPTLPGFERPDA